MTKETVGREIALDALLEILERGAYSHLILRQALNKYQYLEKPERAFISRIVEGTVEYRLQIDYVLNLFSGVKVEKMKPVIRTLLRMSVYQLLYMDRIPDFAVCSQAVVLAGKRKFSGLKGFVNGVLRNISRNKDKLSWPDDSVRYSMPEWLASGWKETYGEETSRKMMEAFLKNKRITMRANLSRVSREELVACLENQGVKAEEAELSEGVFYLENVESPESLLAFQKGWLQVQDLSSCLAGEAADPKEGDFCLDVCGAPGGKSLHLADRLKGSGMVEVRDLSEWKVSLIQENLDRCGFSNIRTRVWDALVTDPDMVDLADIVLADLPCSGLGVIGRKPDIKYRMTPEKIRELAQLQRDILSVVQAYVKPGGRLVYSTCTISRAENEENAVWFLEQFPFTAVNLEGKFGKSLDCPTLKQGYLQLLPGVHPCDGFFLSVFQKRRE